MAFIPSPEVAQAVIKHTLSGEEVNNVLHFITSGAPTAANMGVLASALVESWTGSIMPELSTSLVFTEVTVRDLSFAEGIQVSATPAATVNGGIAGEAYPANVALCLTHRTALIGRSRRGRTFFGGLPEIAGVGNNALAPYVADLKAGWDAVVADVAVAGWVFGVLSTQANKAPRAQGVFTLVTSSIFRDLRFDSQRGRLP